MHVYVHTSTYKYELKVTHTCVKLIQTHVLDEETSIDLCHAGNWCD